MSEIIDPPGPRCGSWANAALTPVDLVPGVLAGLAMRINKTCFCSAIRVPWLDLDTLCRRVRVANDLRTRAQVHHAIVKARIGDLVSLRLA